MNYAIACLKLLELGHEAENNIHNFPEHARVDSAPRTVREMVNDDNDYDEGNRFYGYRWEDWNRALTLVKWYIRNTESSRTKSDNEKSRQTSAKKAIAQIPVYLTEDDLKIDHLADITEESMEDKDDDSPEQRAIKERWRFRELCRTFCRAVAETNRTVDVRRVLDTELTVLSSEDYRRDTKVLEEALSNVANSSANQRRKKGTSQLAARPPLAPGENLKFMRDAADTVTVIWSEQDIINQRDQYAKANLTERASTKKLGKDPKGKGPARNDNGDEMADDDGHSSSAEVNPDAGSDPAELDMADMVELARRQVGDLVHDSNDIELEKTESAWKMREELGKQGRNLPKFTEACAWAGLDPEDLTIPTALRQKGKEPLKYKPHQVIGESRTLVDSRP
jgi:hypothetical protein